MRTFSGSVSRVLRRALPPSPIIQSFKLQVSYAVHLGIDKVASRQLSPPSGLSIPPTIFRLDVVPTTGYLSDPSSLTARGKEYVFVLYVLYLYSTYEQGYVVLYCTVPVLYADVRTPQQLHPKISSHMKTVSSHIQNHQRLRTSLTRSFRKEV